MKTPQKDPGRELYVRHGFWLSRTIGGDKLAATPSIAVMAVTHQMDCNKSSLKETVMIFFS